MRIEIGGQAPSVVEIGAGAINDIAAFVPEGVRQVLVMASQSVSLFAQQVHDRLQCAGLLVHRICVPDAEAGKTYQVAQDAWGLLGREDFTRSDAVIGVGGGAVTDVAGFVAATWLRGVPYITVPTSINGMVDAAVGGKTGINTPAGKNLVGAFHVPCAVVADLDTLATLPTVEFRSGMAEVIKAGFIADRVILDLVDSRLRCGDWDVVPELVARSVQVKANVVAADLRESHAREILNYGHTFGHAIELAEHFRWRHGHAVSVGMVFAAELAVAVGLLSPAVALRHREILGALELPLSYQGASFSQLMVGMRRDKKARGAHLRFVVLEDIAQVTRLVDPPQHALEHAWNGISR